jgi:hypothetical protein
MPTINGAIQTSCKTGLVAAQQMADAIFDLAAEV